MQVSKGTEPGVRTSKRPLSASESVLVSLRHIQRYFSYICDGT